MEVLLEAMFMPLPVYPHSAADSSSSSNLALAATRTDADDALLYPDRQVRLASRVCSFMKLLAEKVNWKRGTQSICAPTTAPRQLSKKRKHDELLLTSPTRDIMTYHQKRQLVFISQAIRDYTNEGLGLDSFQLKDANGTAQRVWTYLTRHFGRNETNFMISTAIEHIYILMRSAAPRLLAGIWGLPEQSQPCTGTGPGLLPLESPPPR